MLKPDNSWNWYFDTVMNSLMLDLGNEMLFRVGLSNKLLTQDAKESDVFNVDDMEAYQNFKENIMRLPLSEARKCELALNATAAHRFHKSLILKSWYFTPQPGVNPDAGQVVVLTTPRGPAHYIVIETDGASSLVMLADLTPVELDDTKALSFCQTIKVMNDRMTPYYPAMDTEPSSVG